MSTVESVAPPDHAPWLAQGLRPFWRRSVSLSAVSVLCWTLVGLLLAILVAMWIDLVWALPAAVRWWITRGGVLLAAAVVVVRVIRLIVETDNDSLARQIDETQKTGGEILTGWQLSSRPVRPVGTMSHGLAAMAAERAGTLVASFLPAAVFPATVLRRAAQSLVAIVVVSALLAIVMPAVAGTQVSRFLSPAADVPPYTGLRIELDLEQDKVLYGQDVLVTATASSEPTERMQLVTTTSEGIENVLPMLPTGSAAATSGAQQWQTMLTRVTEPLQVHARSGTSRSRFHQLDVQLTPQILPPTVRITPPSYTGAGTYQGSIPEDGLSGLPGTIVQWQVQSNRPLSEGHLLVRYRDGSSEQILLTPATEDQPMPANADGDQVTPVTGTLRLSQPGQFALSVIDIEGIESTETVEGTITILQDQRPVVRIVSPRQTSLATPDIQLPVTIAAEDDYGITQLSLYRSLNGSPSREMEFEVDGSSRQNVELQLPLNRYGLQAGDEIQLFTRVEDNDPAGAKGAESPVTTVRIISVQAFQEMMLQRQGAESLQAKYQAAQRHLEKLAESLREVQQAADEAAANPDSQEAAEALRDKLEAAQKAAENASSAIEQLSEQAMPIDVDQQLAERLSEQAKQAAEVARELEAMNDPDAQQQQPLTEQERGRLDELAKQLAADRQRLQDQAIDPMQMMQKILPLLADQQRFVRLTQQQRDLAQRLNTLKANADPKDAGLQRRITDLESEQQRWRESLDQLLDDIQSHADQIANDPELEKLKQTAEQFVADVRASDAMSQMGAAQQHLLDGDLDQAREAAAAAATTLESFLSQCEGMGDKACENCEAAFQPGMGGPKLGNSLQQMLAMMGYKPGSSSGVSQGMGFGAGAGGGFAQRFPGPQNVGMYGSLPTPRSNPARGQGDAASGGVAAYHSGSALGAGNAEPLSTTSATAGGQADQAVPRRYRTQVAEYFRRLTEERQNE